MRYSIVALAAAAIVSGPALADEVTDSLQGAIAAYEDGDLQYALEELTYAHQLVLELRQEALNAFLPDAPDGMEKQMQEGYGGQMGLMANANYRGQQGNISLQIMMDNPQVAQMVAMFSNPQQLAGQGKLVRIGREKFIQQGNNQYFGVINNRVMVRVSGNPPEQLLEMLKSMDLKGLADFAG